MFPGVGTESEKDGRYQKKKIPSTVQPLLAPLDNAGDTWHPNKERGPGVYTWPLMSHWPIVTNLLLLDGRGKFDSETTCSLYALENGCSHAGCVPGKLWAVPIEVWGWWNLIFQSQRGGSTGLVPAVPAWRPKFRSQNPRGGTVSAKSFPDMTRVEKVDNWDLGACQSILIYEL